MSKIFISFVNILVLRSSMSSLTFLDTTDRNLNVNWGKNRKTGERNQDTQKASSFGEKNCSQRDVRDSLVEKHQTICGCLTD